MTDTFAPAAAGFPTPAGTPSAAPRRSPLATLFAALSEDGSYRFLLVLRFLVLNLVAAALLGAAWLKGWVGAVFAGDSTQLVLVITAVFAFGLASCARRILQTSTEINALKTWGAAATCEGRPWEPAAPGRPSARVRRYVESIAGLDGHGRALAASALKLKLGSRIASIRHIANSLVFLGLIGTVIGFIIALSGVDARAAADVGSIGPMVTTLISGMSVALYTTLVGAILNVWLMVNYRLLESGTVTLLTTIVELGERHAQS